ncbi:MAG: hypothetical protein K9M56_04230 [Victivallales bacterium]|nr:hypothetical protein [Victivallales bacterium]
MKQLSVVLFVLSVVCILFLNACGREENQLLTTNQNRNALSLSNENSEMRTLLYDDDPDEIYYCITNTNNKAADPYWQIYRLKKEDNKTVGSYAEGGSFRCLPAQRKSYQY